LLIGEVVRLKTGGPTMPVDEALTMQVANIRYRCTWVDTVGGLQAAVFNAATLERVPSLARRQGPPEMSVP
jgi:uncharacterized protein YodC (DUF2158 family)